MSRHMLCALAMFAGDATEWLGLLGANWGSYSGSAAQPWARDGGRPSH